MLFFRHVQSNIQFTNNINVMSNGQFNVFLSHHISVFEVLLLRLLKIDFLRNLTKIYCMKLNSMNFAAYFLSSFLLYHPILNFLFAFGKCRY